MAQRPAAPPPPPPTPGLIDGAGRPARAPATQRFGYDALVEEVRRAWPDTFDQTAPGELAEAVFEVYPHFRDMVDPLTKGSEVMARTSKQLRAGPQPLETVTNPKRPGLLSMNTVESAGLTSVPGMVGAVAGGAVAGPPGAVGGALLGGIAGSYADQWRQRLFGVDEEISHLNAIGQGVINAVPIGRMIGQGGKLVGNLAEGALGSAAGSTLEVGLEQGRLISPQEALVAGGLGAGFGGAVHGGGKLVGKVQAVRGEKVARPAFALLDQMDSELGAPFLPPSDRQAMAQQVTSILQEAAKLSPTTANAGYTRLLQVLDGQYQQDLQGFATAWLEDFSQKAPGLTAATRNEAAKAFLEGLATNKMTAEGMEQAVRAAAGVTTMAEAVQAEQAGMRMLPPADENRVQSLGRGDVEPARPPRYAGESQPIPLPEQSVDPAAEVHARTGVWPPGTDPDAPPASQARPQGALAQARQGRLAPPPGPPLLSDGSPVPAVADWRGALSQEEIAAERAAQRAEGEQRFQNAQPGELPGVPGSPPAAPWRPGAPAAAVPIKPTKGVDLLPGVVKGTVSRDEAAILQWLDNDMRERPFEPARAPDGATKEGFWENEADRRAFEQDTGRNPNLFMPRVAGTRTIKALRALYGGDLDRGRLKAHIDSLLQGTARKAKDGKLAGAVRKYAQLLAAAHDPATGKLDWARVSERQWGTAGKHRAVIMKNTPETPPGGAFNLDDEAEDILQRFAPELLRMRQGFEAEVAAAPTPLARVETPPEMQAFLGELSDERLQALHDDLLLQGPDGVTYRQYVTQTLEDRGLARRQQADLLAEDVTAGAAPDPSRDLVDLEAAAGRDQQAKAEGERIAREQAEYDAQREAGTLPTRAHTLPPMMGDEPGAPPTGPRNLEEMRAVRAEAGAAPVGQGGRFPPPLVKPGESQPRLPGDVGAVQDLELPTPREDAPFGLTNEVDQTTRATPQGLPGLGDETGAVGDVAGSKTKRLAKLGERAPSHLRISASTFKEFSAQVEKSGESEAAGLVLGTPDGQVRRIFVSRNIADDPTTAFEIASTSLAQAHVIAREHGLQVLGSYHSHPTGSAEPSPRDLKGGVADLPMVIVGTKGGQVRDVRIWQPQGKKSFTEGKFDLGEAAPKPGADFPGKARPIRAAIKKIPRFTAAMGDGIEVARFLRDFEGELGNEPFYHKAQAAYDAGNPRQAWMELQAGQLLYANATREAIGNLPDTKRGRAQADSLRQVVAAREAGSTQDPVGALFALYDGRTTWVPGVGRVVVTPTIPPALEGAGVTGGPGGLLRPPGSTVPLPDFATRERITLDAMNDLMADVEAHGILDTPDPLKITDTRVFRQMAEQMMMHPARFQAMETLGLSAEQVAAHWSEDISNAGKMLAALSVWKQQHREAIRSIEGIMGASGKMEDLLITSRGGAVGRLSDLAAKSSYFKDVVSPGASWDRAFILQAVGKQGIGRFDQFERASTGFMLSQLATAARNFHAATGRWGTEMLDAVMHATALTASGQPVEAMNAFKRAGDLVAQAPVLRPSGWITPWAARQAEFEQIFDFTGKFAQMATPERQKIIGLLADSPAHAAKFIGTMAFDDQRGPAQVDPAKRGARLLNAAASPGVQNFLTAFNRAQEFTVRSAMFHVSLKDQLRQAGFKPEVVLDLPSKALIQLVGAEQWEMILDKSVAESLDFTFSGDTIKTGLKNIGENRGFTGQGINVGFINFANKFPIIRAGYKFARFNLSAAPRYIWDHSGPVGFLGDILADATLGRGRYSLGKHAKSLREVQIPKIDQDVAAARVEMTKTAQTWNALKGELAANRALQKKYDALPLGQQAVGKAEITTHRAALDRIEAAIGKVKSDWASADDRVKVLLDTRAKAKTIIKSAAGANAPETKAMLFARNMTGFAVMLPIAMMIRAQQREEGTKWHDVKYGGHVFDTRPFAPFTQYLFVADVMDSLWAHTDWEKVGQDLKENLYSWDTIDQAFFEHGRYEGPHTIADIAAGLGGLLLHAAGDVAQLPKSVYQFYEGKYTATSAAKEAGTAFLSISQAAGTTLALVETFTEFTERGIDLERFLGQFMGAAGQMMARYTTPFRQLLPFSDLYSDEESHARIADRREGLSMPSASFPSGSALLQAAGNLPFLGAALIPSEYNQLTGKPLDTFMPMLRAGAGVTLREWHEITGAVAANGVPGQAVYIKGTKDPYLDEMIAIEYSRIVTQHMPGILASPDFLAQSSPALKRDYLSKVFSDMKKGALGMTAANLGLTGPHPFGAGAEATRLERRRMRQQQLIEGVMRAEGLEEAEPAGEPDVIFDAGAQDEPEFEPEPELIPSAPPPG